MRTFSKIIFIPIIFTSLCFAQEGNPVYAKNGMVVSASTLASQVGADILKNGGNAIDAAVATGFALAVTYPAAGNIGGGGFMVIHLADGKNTSLDFREMAPLKAHKNMFLDSLGNFLPELSQKSWLASGIPGTVAGLIYALEKYGTMRLKDVIQPAIDLAINGFHLDYRLVNSINYENETFKSIEASRRVFTNDGDKLQIGQSFKQSDLARTLELIRDGGAELFYKGEIAQKIVKESKKYGGIFTLEDFENYQVIERAPLIGNYKGYEIVSMPPPSSGGICLLLALNTLEHFSFSKEEWGSSSYIHTLVEILKQVYADRKEHMGDADFYPVPTNYLISKEYAEIVKSKINDKTKSANEFLPAEIPRYKESEETTHYSVVDKFGNAVSTTYTLNGSFGNKIVIDGLGFLLNNEMDDFSAKPNAPNMFGLLGSEANSIQPKKRMLSSMTPTIVLKDSKTLLVVGSPGGSTIITSVLQVILNVLEHKMNVYEAINAPRIHHQLFPDQIDYEPFGLSQDVKQNLISKGHKIGIERFLGRVEAIYIDYEMNFLFGTSDPRGYGKAIGY
ncbi:MAG: gamma-glutamyltranspeptidase [Ignavibacteria bacterium]|nr:MAG: gamma-glutamyltranspeptidase [Ignavibacteria bacterium]KAF0162109.1 MAG: gamma-glutamyltranspeptidase [Ignavibacteria bacterium]